MSVNLETIDLDSYLLRESFGDPKRWGIPTPMTSAWRVSCGALLQLIVGADGKVSPAEREAATGYLRMLGLTPEEERELGRIDPKTARIEEHVRPEIRSAIGALLYAGISIARVDGLHQAEVAAVERAAKALGVDPKVVVPMVALLDLEDVVLQNRQRLVAPPIDVSRAGEGPMIAEGGPMRAQQYGFGNVPMPRDFALPFGQAALIVAASDRTLAPPEVAWLLGHMRALGAPRDLLAELAAFDAAGTPIESVMGTNLRPFAKATLYLALRTSRADGVSPLERAKAEQAAKLIGLDPMFVTALENQMRIEDALREMRIKLVAHATP